MTRVYIRMDKRDDQRFRPAIEQSLYRGFQRYFAKLAYNIAIGIDCHAVRPAHFLRDLEGDALVCVHLVGGEHVGVRFPADGVVVDGDTGYGGPLNVQKLVRELRSAGAMGVVLEDQTWPKRCGHMRGKSVIDAGEHAAKLRAAADARDGERFIITARTDALETDGMDEALRRARLYKDAGADVLVAGSAVFRGGSVDDPAPYGQNIRAIRDAANAARCVGSYEYVYGSTPLVRNSCTLPRR